MANRYQDHQSGRSRGSQRGWDDNDEADAYTRGGSYDQGRVQYGRDSSDQSGSTGRYAGYGEWGQGDYSGSGRNANTGQNRYGQSGYGGRGDQGYYGQSDYGAGRYERDRDERNYGSRRTSGSDYGYGYGGYGSEARGQKSWNEPYGEGQQYRSESSWDRGGSRYAGDAQRRGSQSGDYHAGSGQSSGYGGPLYSGAQPGSEFSGLAGAQGGGSQYGNYGSESVFGGRSQFGPSQYGYSSNQGQGMHRGKGPKGYQRSDERTKELISERLRDDPHIDASEITVNVSAGKVTLDGTVDSRQAKNAVEDIVEHCGCDDVQNNLRVQRATETGSMGSTAKAASTSDKDKGESARQRH